MPPQVGRADAGTPVKSQAPVTIEQPKSTEVDKNAAQKPEPPKEDAQTTAKNAEAAKQLAKNVLHEDTSRVQILRNQIAQKLPEKTAPTEDVQKPTTGSPQTLKDQLAEKIAKGSDTPKILPDTVVAQAGPNDTVNDTPPPGTPKHNIPVKTAKGVESLPFPEYERRWNAANDFVKREAALPAKNADVALERLGNLRQEAAKKFGLPGDWFAARNEPEVMRAIELNKSKYGNNAAKSGAAETNAKSQPAQVDQYGKAQAPKADPHAKTGSPSVDPHGNTQPGPVDAHAKTEAAAAKTARAAEEGAAAGKAVGATEKAVSGGQKAVSTGAKVVEGTSVGVRITSPGAKVLAGVTHMAPIADALMLEFEYFTSYAKAHDIIREKNTEKGFAVGMAASLMGASPKDFGLNAIDRGVVTQVLGAEGIAEKSHNKGVYDGYKYAQTLSIEERNKLRNEAFKSLATSSRMGYHTKSEDSFDKTDVIRTAGQMLPGVQKLFSETRKAAELEELKNRKEKNPTYGSKF
jgi:hypothetical protein